MYSTVVYDTVVYDTVVYDTVVYDTVVYDTVVYDTVVYEDQFFVTTKESTPLIKQCLMIVGMILNSIVYSLLR